MITEQENWDLPLLENQVRSLKIKDMFGRGIEEEENFKVWRMLLLALERRALIECNRDGSPV